MKTKHLLIIAFALATALFFSSCKKQYDEGPRFSLRSAENRINGRWLVKKYYVDGTDQTQLYNDSCGCNWLIQIVHDDSDYWGMIDCSKPNYSRGWEFSFFKNEFSLLNESIAYDSIISGPFEPFNRYESTGKILRLTKKDFWIEFEISNKIYHFEAEKL